MDLKTFVAESLAQIAEGIKEVQKANTGAIVSPRVHITDKGMAHIARGMSVAHPQMVAFDVAVYVAESGTDKAGGKIGVSFVSIGGEVSSAKENSATSHIRFEVPVLWPDADHANNI